MIKTLLSLTALSFVLIGCGGPPTSTDNYRPESGGKISTANLHRHNGTSFEALQLNKDPKYYILYYSASW